MMAPQAAGIVGGGEQITNDIAGICGCCNAFPSALLAMFCPCVVYGQNRERVGIQAFAPACAVFVLALVALQAITHVATASQQDAYVTCLVGGTCAGGTSALSVNGVRGCDCSELSMALDGRLLMCQVVNFLVLAALLGPNRSALQKATGQPDGGPANFILGAFCVCCIQAQEHRVIEAKWRANNMQVRPPFIRHLPIIIVRAFSVRSGALLSWLGGRV